MTGIVIRNMNFGSTILKRKASDEESTVLWDVSVFFFTLGIAIFVLLALFDATQINGEPRWLKPLKFFISIAIYNLTLEWLYRIYKTASNVAYLNVIRWVIASGMVVEAVLIVLQAARGVQSHFNATTPLDVAIFAIMGVVITIVVIAVLISGFIIWKARSMASPLLSEAIIYGILIMTAASFQGFSMPTNVETVPYPP